MFNIGGGEFVALAILALILIGPDKLPTFAQDAAKFINRVRGMASKATEELRSNLGPGFEDLQVTDLRPKSLLKKHLNEALIDPKDFEVNRENKSKSQIDPDLL